jgi:quinol monooxygenase YgiN
MPPMTVAVHITPHKMTREDYEKVICELEAWGCGEPQGRILHAAYGDDDVHVFELWNSKEEFEAHRQRLTACLQAAGIDSGPIEIHTTHSPHPD